ncbi:hypothetical protein [Bradyrhizobium neotropicale]|uniref:hypothetical protein n=1 Tax=Bradyrhizobium neotropicale TaxID=1497615 RepID=UPI001AD6E984|nr:hypothetical protein [Bradyrhizobium neotropicale]MBO4228037.1 hypothetical protein [Bradyrhizobium neotropicale]
MPKFDDVSCSQCGGSFGPGDHGFSHCENHTPFKSRHLPDERAESGDLISRSSLLAALRKERDDYFREHFFQDPATGTHEASDAKEEYLSYLDERVEFIESFPAVETIATPSNNNQPDTSDEACAIACMLVSNPQGAMRKDGDGWRKRVNDLIRALRDERSALREKLDQLSYADLQASGGRPETSAERADR